MFDDDVVLLPPVVEGEGDGDGDGVNLFDSKDFADVIGAFKAARCRDSGFTGWNPGLPRGDSCWCGDLEIAPPIQGNEGRPCRAPLNISVFESFRLLY
jgi:hypothetical protein